MGDENHERLVALIERVQGVEGELRDYLNELSREKRRWLLLDDPVRTKNLEKIVGHLQTVLTFLHSQRGSPSDIARSTSLASSLDQLKDPAKLSSNNAWELADLLEIELINLGDGPYLYTLLKGEPSIRDGESDPLQKNFSADVARVLTAYSKGQFGDTYSVVEARRFLEYARWSRIDEYRRDRAKVRLRAKYLNRMVLILAVLDIALCYFLLAVQPALTASVGVSMDADLLALVLLSGAVGSVLSRASSLGKQPLHAATNNEASPPLGIRTLLSGWTVFVAQPVIGATAALVLFLVFHADLIQIGGQSELATGGYALLGFLAGFSEPFFLKTLDKVAGSAGTL